MSRCKKYEFAQPMRFARPGDDLPPLSINYYYSQSDSVVRCVTYTMDTPNDGSLDRYGISFYKKIFSDMTAELAKELGTPDQQDKEFKVTENFIGMKSYKKEVIWEKGATICLA